MTSDEFSDIEQLDENLRKWFKEKWVRFGPDGKIRGACARGDDSEGKPKCLPQKKAQNLGKKGRKYAASKKRREDPNPERRGKAKNVATKKKTNEDIPFNECPQCRGPIVHESMINEKQDACYHKVKSRYKVWPSAYASGALVQCRKKGASNWGTGGKKKNESSIMKGIVDEASGTPGGLELYRTPAMVNATMQQNLYKRELAPIKAAEKKRKEAEYRKNNPSVSVPSIQIGASNYPIHVIHNWIGSKDLNAAVEFAVNKFAYRQSKDFKTEIAGDPDFQKAVKNFFNVAEKSLNHRNSTRTKSHWDGKIRAAPRETDTSSDGFDAINKINDALLPYYKKYGVDKTGRRVPPNFNYALGEDKAKPYVRPFIENGKQVGWKSSDGYHVKYWQMFAKDSAIKHAKLNPDEVDEAVDWQQGKNNNEHDHTLGDAEEYLAHVYPVVKKYMIRRAEVGFRATEKQFLKSMSHMKDVDAVIKYLGLDKLPTMSGSKQATSSIGYTWTTFLSPNKKAAILYYQDRGMGQDMIYIAAADKTLHRKIYDLFVDAGVIAGRDKKMTEPELPDAMRVSNATNRDEAFKKAMDKFYNKTDDKDVNEDYTGQFAAEKTPAINPYGGLKDRQHRGAISETPTDNPTGASGEGGWRKYKPKSAGEIDEAKKSEFRLKAEQQQLKQLEKINNSTLPHWAKEYLTLLTDPKGKVFKAAYYSFGKGQDARKEAAEYIMQKYKIPQEWIDKINFLKGSHVTKNREEDRHFNWDMPSMHEDTSYASGGGHGGNAGESYRKFKPKSAGTFKEDELDEACWKGYHKEGNKKMFGKTYPNCVKNTNEEEQLDEKCWDTHKQVGMKNKGGRQVPNCVPKESAIMKGINRLI